MSNNLSNEQTFATNPSTQSTDNAANHALTPNVAQLLQRFNTMQTLVTDPIKILEKPYVMTLLYGMDANSMTEREIQTAALLMYTQIKKSGISAKMPTPKNISDVIQHAIGMDDPWIGRNYVGEQDGEIFIQTNKKGDTIRVSNFTLEPLYTVTVRGGETHLVYNVYVKDDDNGPYRLVLTPHDFNTLHGLQEQIKKQLGDTRAIINGCANYMKDLSHKYVTLADWKYAREGTSLIGLEVINERKYFCTPQGIYDLQGNVCTDIEYVRSDYINDEEVRKLENLAYDADKWKNDIAPTLLKNLIKIHEKSAMLSLAGWMGAIPHDYVIRKEASTGFFPHCHIVGEPGSGKSTLLTLLKQFMGHNDAAPRVFSTAFETAKILNYSYTIPAILDEYGKRWSQTKTEAINNVLVEAFTKAPWSRGQSDLGSVYFKYKNPVLMAGQVPVNDNALSTRVIPVYLYKYFHRSEEGKKAYQHLTALQQMPDKNFWVGYNLWCAKYSNEEVLKVYNTFRNKARLSVEDSRTADIYAVVMLGLYFLKKLSEELGITEHELGYKESDIFKMPDIMRNTANSTDNADVNPLYDFLSDLASLGIRYGNHRVTGKLFGQGLAVMPYKPPSDGAGEYGNSKKETACIYGRELILIKVSETVRAINERYKHDKYNEKELMTFIEAKFREAMADPPNGLVLAPRQYKTRYGMYTAFNKEKLLEIFPEFANIDWLFTITVKTEENDK